MRDNAIQVRRHVVQDSGVDLHGMDAAFQMSSLSIADHERAGGIEGILWPRSEMNNAVTCFVDGHAATMFGQQSWLWWLAARRWSG